MKMINSDLSFDFITLVSWVHIDSSILFFFFTSNNNVIPLCFFTQPDSIWQLLLWKIKFTFISFLMEVLINFLAIWLIDFSHWTNKNLSWWKEEWPLSSKMLNQDSSESFNRSQNGSVNDNWSGESWFDLTFLPGKLVIVILICWEDLFHHNFIFFAFAVINVTTLISLILQVESNWQLEIKLDGTALMMSL